MKTLIILLLSISLYSCTKQEYKYNVSYNWCEIPNNRASSHYEFNEPLTEEEEQHLCYSDSLLLVDIGYTCIDKFTCELILN